MITAVEGRAASAEELSEIRCKLGNEPPGTSVALTVLRGSESHAATQMLRDRI